MLVSFARQTVTRVRAAVVVDHGAEVEDWDNPVTAPIPGCIVDTTSGTRDTANRDGSLVALVVLCPPDADVKPTDRFRVTGYPDDFALTQPPRREPSPTGRLAHIQLDLAAWVG